MSRQSIFCIATSRVQTDRIIYRLKDSGFSPADISVLFPDKSIARQLADENGADMPEAVASGIGAGGGINGALGWLAGIGALAIPGAGPFVVAGPVLAALSGVAREAAVGGVAGALAGFGISEYEARHYEGRIHDGGILISVHTDDAGEGKAAREIFEDLGARDIATTGEEPVHPFEEEPAAMYGEKPTGYSLPPIR